MERELSKNYIDLVTPGDPSDVPQEVWEQGSRDQYESDRIADLHRLYEEKALYLTPRSLP